MNSVVVGPEITTLESLQVDLDTIQVATNKFSEESRIGKGGYGEVYKVIYIDVMRYVSWLLFNFLHFSSDGLKF